MAPLDVETMAITAHENANLALEKIDSHDKVCSERYTGIYELLRSLEKKQFEHQQAEMREWKMLNRRILGFSYSIIGLLFSIIFSISYFVVSSGFLSYILRN